MVIPDLLTDFYRERIEDNQAYMSHLQGDVGRMQELREASPEDWEMQELTRHIIFLEAQSIEGLRKEIENDRKNLKKLERL
jgi:hypothetical protein